METSLYTDKHTHLIEACKQYDRKAQYEVYKLYSKAMFNVSMRILNHVAEAEDVLQESFLDAFQKIGEFRQSSTFGAWLKQIVVNRSINYLRQRKVTWQGIDDHLADIVPEDTQTDWAEADLQVEQIHRAIQSLPDGFRAVLSLYLLEGYDHEEIAQILNISEVTSRTQYIRAKKRLLEKL